MTTADDWSRGQDGFVDVRPRPGEPEFYDSAPKPSDSFLELRDLRVHFPTDDGLVKSADGLSFTLERGRTLGIVGESGSGKSVTSLAIMGLHKNSRAKITGQIWLDGEELVAASIERVRGLRGKKMAMIFQDPLSAMHPYYTVGAQIIEAYRIHNKVSKAVARKHAIEMLDRVGIPQPGSRVDDYPHQFSGGMRQRAMIAMALSCDPELLIADEPTTALDVTVQAQILETLVRISTDAGAAIMLITHDLGVVAGMADRVQVMYGGTVVEAAEVTELFAHPRMPYTVGLLGSVPHPEMVGRRLTPIHGAPPSPLHLPPGCTFGPRCPLVREDPCLLTEPELVMVGGSGDGAVDGVDETHATRCHRWSELTGDQSARLMFSSAEIGLHEAPAADLVEEQ